MINEIKIEYDETKDKFYVTDKETNKIIETFFGEFALKEYLVFDRMLDFDEVNNYIEEVYAQCH